MKNALKTNSPVEVSVERIADTLRTAFGRFPHVVHIIARIDRMIKNSCEGAEPENLMIIGEAGVGKSRILRQVAASHPRILHAEFTEVPVLLVSVPAKSNIEGLAKTMLLELGSIYWDRGKERQLTIQLKTLLKECKVRLIILDEVNHLVDKGGLKTHHLIADWIKQLIDDSGIPIVMAGIPRAERLLAANDQLRSRFREVITIYTFSIETALRAQEMRRVMKTFAGWLGDLPTVDISTRDMARHFVFATAGRLRDIRRLLVRAVELTGDKGNKTLDRGILGQAFQEVIYPDAPDKRNPFYKNFNNLPLTKPGEPFAPREE